MRYGQFFDDHHIELNSYLYVSSFIKIDHLALEITAYKGIDAQYTAWLKRQNMVFAAAEHTRLLIFCSCKHCV